MEEELKSGVIAAPSALSRQDFHLRWAKLGAPQRPPRQVVEAMRPLLAGRHALQLGVTPEIAALSASGVAVDSSAPMIRKAWPGDSGAHRAILGNWLAMPLEAGSVDAVFGDASLSVLQWPDECAAVLREVARVLRFGGRMVLRCFAGPDRPETVDQLAAAALAGEAGSFGAFKLRFNMASFAACERKSVSEANTGRRIHQLFDKQFPDRARLAAAAGWTLDEISGIDAYADSPSIHSYPTRAQLGLEIPVGFRHYFLETSGYALAERCPVLVADFVTS